MRGAGSDLVGHDKCKNEKAFGPMSFTATKEKIKTDNTHYTVAPEQKMETDLTSSGKNENRIREEKGVQQRTGTTQTKCKT
jgi:hypothetical protein